jgi:surface antigen
VHHFYTKFRLVLGTLMFLASLIASSSSKASTLAYPNSDMPCEHYPYGTSGTCSHYDWGLTHTEAYNDPSELSSRGYAYRNCTDYVAWKESTVGITVPHTLGNGGQWYTNAPPSEQSTSPKAWDAAVVPGNPGHVAVVESVNSIDASSPLNDNITISEYNYAGTGEGDTRTGTAASMGFTEFVDFGVHPTTATYKAVPDDFNGDGKSDVALYYTSSSQGTPLLQILQSGGNGFSALSNTYGWGPPTKAVTGDFNGDGKTDLLWIEPYGGSYVGQVMLSTGAGFVSGWNNYGWGPPTWIGTGYFDSDNKADVALYYPNSSQGTPVLQVLKSTGSGFAPLSNSYGWGPPGKAAVGDFNGDGLSDILWLELYGGAYVAEVMESNGTGFVRAG